MESRMRKINSLLRCATLASIGFVSPLANAQFIVDPAQNVLVGTQPSGMAAGDFDNDGDIDLATTVDNPDRIVVLLNDGAGSYSMGPVTLLPNSSSPQDLIAANLDGKGGIDLAVAVRDPQGSVLIMRNIGGGSFTMMSSVIVGDRPRGLTASDMDNDGDIDLAVANRNSDTASVLTNNGAGGFTATTFFAGAEPRAAAFTDFNNDGVLDLAVTIHDDRLIATFTNNSGAFVFAGSYSVGPFVRPDGITSADLDGDGKLDLAVAVDDQTFNINQVAVFINTGNGFSGPFNYDTGGMGTNKISAADFDCDGLLDLVTTNQDSNSISLLRNLGGAIFAATMQVSTGARPGEIVAGDFDSDGDWDFATANRDSNNVSVFINQTCTPAQPCPWDLDGDTFVTTSDLLALLAVWGSNPGGPPDFDGDGVVSTNDLLALLANWGPCP